MRVLLLSAVGLASFVSLGADYHAAPGYLLTDLTNITWALDSGAVISSGFEHLDYDSRGNLLVDTSTYYTGPAVSRSTTQYVLDIHGHPISSSAEFRYSDPLGFYPPSRTSTVYFYTNAGRLAGYSAQTDSNGDGIPDEFTTEQDFYNPRGLPIRAVTCSRDSFGTYTSIRQSQWSARGDLVSYSDAFYLVGPVQTNVATELVNVTTTKDSIVQTGETDLDGDGQPDWFFTDTTIMSAQRPISAVDEVLTSTGELLWRSWTIYTWDSDGNLVHTWSETEYLDGSLPNQISVTDYSFVKRPFVNSMLAGAQEAQELPGPFKRIGELREKMGRKLFQGSAAGARKSSVRD